MFVFAGRQPNIELALPFYQRLLTENPNLQIDLWDLARDKNDSRYLRTLSADRLNIRTEYAGNPSPWRLFNQVWGHYTQLDYQDHLFVKADDDCVFYETDRFKQFIDAADTHRDTVISALTINNGATTPHVPALNAGFKKLGIPLLDVHLSEPYADMCHTHMIDNWQTLVNRRPKLIPTEDWLSINCIAYDWNTGRHITQHLGRRSPSHIAGRDFKHGARVGDEGAVNMQRRAIYKGFTVAHLTFGPQNPSDEHLDKWRQGYAAIGRKYLNP